MGLLSRAVVAALIGYGVVAAAGLVAISVFRDGTVATYTAALVSFWWLLPAPVLAVLALALRRWRTAALLAVLALVWLAVHGPPLPRPDAGPPELRLVTYNMEPYLVVDHVVALVDRTAPDVLLLQEVRPEVRDDLARQLPSHPHQWFAPVIDAATAGGGTAVLSRHPVTAVEQVTGLPEGSRPTAVVTLDVDGRALRVVSVHLASPCLRCTPEEARANPAGTTGDAARVRVAEARRLAAVVASLGPDVPVVVAGDLNSAELNQPVRLLLRAGLTDVHRAVGAGPGLTRSPAPGLARIDVVLTRGLRAVATAEGEPGRSAHSPVVADLAWAASSG